MPQIASQTEVVARLKTGLDDMRGKLDDLKRKRDELVARSKSAAAQSQVLEAVKSIDVMDPTSRVSRFEEKVRRDEARAAGQAELPPRRSTPSSTPSTTWLPTPTSRHVSPP